MANSSVDSEDALDLAMSHVDSSVSQATSKSYRQCWNDFVSYCDSKTQNPLTCDSTFVMKYLARKSKHVGQSRLYVYLSSISHYYHRDGKVSPCDDHRIRMMMKGIII